MTEEGLPGSQLPALNVADLRKRVAEFDSLIEKAIREKYFSYQNLTNDQAEMIVRDNLLVRFNLADIVDSLLENPLWIKDRGAKVMDYFFDLKLQLYYLAEVDLGIYNRAYHDPINADPSLAQSPRMLLIRLSLDQNIIGKSRVLWERLMNLVYYLETGNDLEGRKSKKKAFFTLVNDLPRWCWLLPYGDVLTRYDEAFRTPEFHKHSVLRAVFTGSKDVDANDLLGLVNRATEILDNIRAVLREGKPISFSDLHLDAGGNVDPKYLTP